MTQTERPLCANNLDNLFHQPKSVDSMFDGGAQFKALQLIVRENFSLNSNNLNSICKMLSRNVIKAGNLKGNHFPVYTGSK